MECSRCSTSLSIQDLDKNEWLENCEIFTLKCPVCSQESKLESNLFDEHGHLSNQYLKIIVIDSKDNKKEKYLNYIPLFQRNKILNHLSSCSICSERTEELRLSEISYELDFNEKIYKFFIEKSKDVYKELDPTKIQLDDSSIKSFTFEDETYEIKEEDLFYHNNQKLNNVDIERLCYNLEKDEFSVGMVSFVKSNGKIILEKIWLKSEQRIEKEKEFLQNIRSGKIRILFDLIQKLHAFL